MVKEMPDWFVWTTTAGLALALILLWLNYTALTSANRANFAMMQTTADMNMMNGGMMQMMARAMMKNNMMDSDEFSKISNMHNSSFYMNEQMNGMMSDGAISDSELGVIDQSHMGAKGMMGMGSGMMGGNW